MELFRCKSCGNIISHYVKGSGQVMCCGAKMEKLIPNSLDASLEKHVPFVEIRNSKVIVKVGIIPHPMLPEHKIEFIVVETDYGIYKKQLKASDEPMAIFSLNDNEKVLRVYEYCNLHSLWVKEV